MSVWMITGATGFLGRHVLNALEAELQKSGDDNATVVAVGRRRPDGLPESRFEKLDLERPEQVRDVLTRIAPDHVIYTAGRTPPSSDQELYISNFWTTIRFLNALRALRKPVKVTLAGSAAELGPVPTTALPVAEDYRCNPVDAYGRSKWMASLAALAEQPPLAVNVARIFNPIGTGQPASQAFGEFAAQLRSPLPDPLTLITGELDVRRDFVDVRDAAAALVAVASRGQPGLIYHVGTGKSHTVREGLDRLIELSGRSVRVCVDPMRKARKGPLDSRAAIDRINAHTGWAPTISFEQSLSDAWNESLAQSRTATDAPAPRLPLTA